MLYDTARKDLFDHIMAGRRARSQAAFSLLSSLRTKKSAKTGTASSMPKGHAPA